MRKITVEREEDTTRLIPVLGFLFILLAGVTLAACGGGGGGGGGGGDDDTTDGGDDGEAAESSTMNGVDAVSVLPSKIRVTFQVFDPDGNPVPGLTDPSFEDNFLVEQDGKDISTNVESFTQITPARGLGFTIPSVFVLDISSSITDAELQTAIDGLRDTLIDETDPANPSSKLEEGQSVALLVFDAEVDTWINLTQSARQIQDGLDSLEALDRQARNDNDSTNLYGAALAGLDAWDDAFNSTEITQGYMVLVTDGADTSGIFSENDVITTREAEEARVFTIPIGSISEGEKEDLDNLASQPDFALETIDFDTLGTEVSNIADSINEVLNAIYTLEYVTSARGGTVPLSITYTTGEGEPSIDTEFNADEFSGTRRELRINQRPVIAGELLDSAVNIPPGETSKFVAETRWTNTAPDHVWTEELASVSPLLTLSASGSELNITAESNTYGNATISVVDNNNSNPDGSGGTEPVREEFEVYVTDTSVSTPSRVLDFGQSVDLNATTLAANDPVFSWKVSSDSGDPELCTLQQFNGSEVTLETNEFSSVSFGTCEVRVEDSANGPSVYVLTVTVGREGTPLPISSVSETFDFESSGGVPADTGDWNVVDASAANAPAESGGSVLESNDIGDEESTSFSITMSNATSVSFDYRVSSEFADELRLLIDGSEVFFDAGDTGWLSHEQTGLDGGEHTFTWVYEKDFSVSELDDKAWVDNIEFR